tara:strand:+ start:873 stop:1385 length:513 start_codon:yes stop_codon:yes gene_type:complete
MKKTGKLVFFAIPTLISIPLNRSSEHGTLKVSLSTLSNSYMDISLLLAQTIGLYLVLEGLVILTQKKFVVNVVTDMSNHKALMYVTAVMLTVLGLLVVLNHNVWESTWRVVPTIVGWAMLVKGVMLFFVPNMVMTKARRFAKNRNMAVLAGLIALAVGAYLVYVGFGLGA